MKKLALALGLAVAAMNVSAAEEVPSGTKGGVLLPVATVLVVTGAAIAAADHGGSKGTSGTVAP